MGTAKILIVEDEPLIAMMLEDFIESLGHSVTASVDTVADGLTAVAAGGFDMAILDISLRHGEASWPIADALEETGKPFVLATGGQVEAAPERHARRPYLAKPYTLDAVETAIARALEK